MRTKEILIGALLLLASLDAQAWGEEGHRVIGRAAFALLDDTARRAVLDLLGNPSPDAAAEAIGYACNWPDYIRDEPEWRWSPPLHYVNIPRHDSAYDRERDCPDGRCVTEGILHFANQLTRDGLEREKRWQAFAFTCHLVADLHQPLHAGFRDDRGGNTVGIEYRGEDWNLHQFWDGVLVRERLRDEEVRLGQLTEAARTDAARGWQPTEVKAWTEESHALALQNAYPAEKVIDEAFADRSWALTLECWERAAGRLARLLNAVLGESRTA